MILGLLSDPALRIALRRAASPEEDVLLGPALSADALRQGFPRLLVHDEEAREEAARLLEVHQGHSLELGPTLLSRWDGERRSAGVLVSRADAAAPRLRVLLRQRNRPSWVDLALRDLSRAAGAPLPPPFRGFARRVMEFPARYDDLHGVSLLTGLSAGALKARFRRRALESPYLHLRWLRCLAAAHVLSDPAMTTLQASHRLGFTTDGNFCRTIRRTTGLTPTVIRSRHGWNHLLVTFATRFLGAEAREGWSELERLFVRPAA